MIYVLGIGPGSLSFVPDNLSVLCENVQTIVGSERQLEVVSNRFDEKKIIFPRGGLDKLIRILQKNEYNGKSSLVLASGDPLLYGIGSYLYSKFNEDSIQLYPGISSIQYMFSQIGMSMNETFMSSSHGRKPNFYKLSKLDKIAMVTDDKIGPYEIAQNMLKYGFDNATMFIGEKLSYPDEVISKYKLVDVPDKNYKMNVVVIYNER